MNIEVLDAPTPPRKLPLANIGDVRLEMARLYRRVDCGDIESGEANRRVWHLTMIAKCIEISEIDLRMRALEDAQERRKS